MTTMTGLDKYRADRRAGSDQRLREALERLTKDAALDATQVKLAELAGLSRRALSLPDKRWALDALEGIKKARIEQQKKKSRSVDERVAAALARANEAEAALAAVRSHVAGLVEENDGLTRQVAALKRELAMLKRKG